MGKYLEIYVERISVNSEKVSNIKKLEEIAQLEDGWDGEGARAFSDTLIQIDNAEMLTHCYLSLSAAFFGKEQREFLLL